jgi:hypothetical protein
MTEREHDLYVALEQLVKAFKAAELLRFSRSKEAHDRWLKVSQYAGIASIVLKRLDPKTS